MNNLVSFYTTNKGSEISLILKKENIVVNIVAVNKWDNLR